MSDVIHIHRSEPSKPNASVIGYLEDILERARSGDIQGLVAVHMDSDEYAAYALVGSVGGFSMQGALACASAVIANVNLNGVEDD